MVRGDLAGNACAGLPRRVDGQEVIGIGDVADVQALAIARREAQRHSQRGALRMDCDRPRSRPGLKDPAQGVRGRQGQVAERLVQIELQPHSSGGRCKGGWQVMPVTANEEAIVTDGARLKEGLLVCQRPRRGDCRRVVRHVQDGDHATGERRPRAGKDIFLVHCSGFPEVHMDVNQAGQAQHAHAEAYPRRARGKRAPLPVRLWHDTAWRTGAPGLPPRHSRSISPARALGKQSACVAARTAEHASAHGTLRVGTRAGIRIMGASVDADRVARMA